jgi:hypothetical protein
MRCWVWSSETATTRIAPPRSIPAELPDASSRLVVVNCYNYYGSLPCKFAQQLNEQWRQFLVAHIKEAIRRTPNALSRLRNRRALAALSGSRR